MAIKRVNREWSACVQGFRDDFVVDSDDDFKNLPQCCVGSTALSAESGDVMIVNASDEWVKMGG